MIKELEIWRKINGYPELYEISNHGRVKALAKKVYYSNGRIRNYKEAILKPIESNGYRTTSLYDNKHKIQIDIHRLVGIHFIENPNKYDTINHKDGDRSNNYFENLEWCTQAHNNLHSYRVLNRKGHHKINNRNVSKEIKQMTKEGVLIKIWPSIMEITRVHNYNKACICECCTGKQKTAYGYKWAHAI